MNNPPVCTKCSIFMKCKKNDYVVGTVGNRRWNSDRFECLKCGASVAILASKYHPEPLPLNSILVKADTTLRKDQ